MMNNTPSGAKKHCGSTKPESLQMAKTVQHTNPSYTYLFTLKICGVELCTELFYTIILTSFLCFLLICYPYILLFYFFVLVHIIF